MTYKIFDGEALRDSTPEEDSQVIFDYENQLRQLPEKVRTERDAKLAATDWTASTDVTMTAEMTAYRQALRDVPAQSGFPNTIDWPEV